MKGDFTRRTFNKKNHYRKVKMQQGRVQVDADWNEQVDIDFHYERASLRDLIGATGTPIDSVTGYSDGFMIESNPTTGNPTDYKIKRGHYYVDGILCENEADVNASQQEDLHTFKNWSALPPPNNSGAYFVYLDVWERHLTALDDPVIHDVALLGADTATRAKIVWQVKVLPASGEEVNCLSEPQIAPSNGKLRARARPTLQSKDPCVLPPEAGYRGLGTQLYRVEISDSGEIRPNASNPPPTFKWSRDNGSVISKILAVDETYNKLSVNSTGRDNNLGFNNEVWGEVIDDRRELWGIPGTFVKITEVDQNQKTLTFNPTPVSPDLG